MAEANKVLITMVLENWKNQPLVYSILNNLSLEKNTKLFPLIFVPYIYQIANESVNGFFFNC
jgi:hypothetical protein